MNVFENRPVCLIGLGLIGGSILRDLHAHRRCTVYGYNRSTSGARSAIAEGYDVSDDLDATLARASEDEALIVIAVPMHAVDSVLDKVAQLAPNCGLTDVVSVKSPVLKAMRERGLDARYVGGHPMAGTEFSGWKASKQGLFKRAAWVVTYDYAANLDAAGQRVPNEWISVFRDVVELTRLVGAEAVPSRVEHHDAAVARVSHLPHVLASALSIVGDNGGTLAQSLAAGSFKDATRVAGTEPSLQRAMCETNAPALITALDEIIKILSQARENLSNETPDISELVNQGHQTHERLIARSGARKESVSPIKISSRPVLRLSPGKPNWVRQLAQTEDLGGRIEIF